METRRILVIANETVVDVEIPRAIFENTGPGEVNVVVVSPALNSRLRHWVSDTDEATEQARRRLDASLATLREAGIEAEGEVGDPDPLQAIRDALATIGADEIVISSHEPAQANWLEKNLEVRARRLADLPVKQAAGRRRDG